MPVLRLYSPDPPPVPQLLDDLCEGVSALLKLPPDHCWAMWEQVPEGNFSRPAWSAPASARAPIVFICCKASYAAHEIEGVLLFLRERLTLRLGCVASDIFVGVQRLQAGELLVRNEIWNPEG